VSFWVGDRGKHTYKSEYRELDFCMHSNLCLISSLKAIESIFDILLRIKCLIAWKKYIKKLNGAIQRRDYVVTY